MNTITKIDAQSDPMDSLRNRGVESFTKERPRFEIEKAENTPSSKSYSTEVWNGAKESARRIANLFTFLANATCGLSLLIAGDIYFNPPIRAIEKSEKITVTILPAKPNTP